MDAPLPSPEATGTPQGQPSAFDGVGIGLLEADPGTGRLLKVNRAYCEITGYSADELLGMTAGDLNHEDDAAWDARAYGRLARGESHYEVDKRYVRKDGRVVWVHVVGDVIRDGAGRIVRVYAAVSDITARVRTEQTLRDLAERQAYLLALDAALQPLQDEAAVQHTATRLLGQYLHAARVLYVDVEPGSTFAIRATFGRGAPLSGRWPIPPFGGDLVASLLRGEALVIDDTATDPRLDEAARAPFRQLGIGATMGVALLDGGRWVGAFGAHESRARAWTPWEVTAMRETAARTWAAVQRARTGMLLRDSEARYRLLFEHSTTGVVVTDAEGLIVQCNPAFAALVGRTLPDLEGASISAVVHPDDRDAHRRRGELFWNGAEPACDWEHRCLRPDGSEVWVRCVCHREHDETGRMARLARFVTDITDRRQAEGALRESQEQRHDLVETLHLLLETSAQGILSIDEGGRIASANRAVEDMFGYGRDALLGESVERLLPEALRGAHARHRAAFWRAPEPRAMGRGRDLVGMRADGTTFPIEVSLNYVMTNGGGRAVAFITDISERKAVESTLADAHAALKTRARELERQTRQLRRMASALTVAEQRARESLARTLHDHLQQLLFSTKLRLDRLERSLDASRALPAGGFASVRADLDEAIAAARSLAVEIYPPVLQRHGLPSALAWLASWMREKYGLTVTLSADPAADVDDRDTRTLLFESVRELLFDVVKHAGVTTATVDLAALPDGRIRITVKDEGHGFDPAAIMGRDDGGSGLGLARIREHLTSLGGQFEVESEVGRGARFRLLVPRERPDEEAVDASEPSRSGAVPLPLDDHTRVVRVLVVDDHAAVRQGLVEILRDTPGVAVVGEAANGEEAVETALALLPDVVVMDVSMPGLDGVEATRRILAQAPSIRIFGFSTHERTDRLHAIEDAGAVGYFLKQTDSAELVRRILDSRRS